MKTKYKEHPLKYILIPLIFIISIVSFYRFVIRQDYLVRYEGVCDPTTDKCFLGCEDDACTQEYNYSKVVKYAPDIYSECGDNITDCEAASICLPSDRMCSITYCDTSVDGDICTIPQNAPNIQNDNPNSTEGEFLQDNNNQI